MSDVEVDQLFQQGVAAVRAGEKAKAREILTKVVERDQLHEQAWLWLSAAVESHDERIVCLQNVLTINPKNEMAIQGLQKLGAPLPAAAPAPAPPPAPPPGPEPSTGGEDQWRFKLYDEAQKADYASEASIVRDKAEAPPRDLNDLANAWLSALIFKVMGSYQEEVDYGAFGHILLNVGIAVLLQTLGLAIPMAVFVVTKRSPAYLLDPIAQSSAQMSQALSRLSALNMVPAPLRPAIGYLFPAANTGISVPVATPAVLASLGTLSLILIALLILSTFVILLFQSMVVNRVAEALGGRGNVFQTSLALSVALVATQVMQLPVFFLIPLLPFSLLVTLLVAIRVYEFMQYSVAVQAAHRLNVLVSMGVIILSDVAIGVALPCLFAGLVFLASRAG